MSNNLIDREITQGIIPIGTPKAYKYDAALVEAAKATVQQGMTGIAEKTEEEKTELDGYTEAKKAEVSTVGQGYVDSASQKVAEANTILSAIRNEYGYPFTAATAADMTDTSKIYVYVGNEAGYVNGNWYYNNGTAWVSGGVYNAIAVQTDKTLTVEDVPADAKMTGDAIKSTKAKMSLFGVDDLLWDSTTGRDRSPKTNAAGVNYIADTTNKTVTVVGTSTGTSFYRFFYSVSDFPQGMKAGGTYIAHLDTDADVTFFISYYKNNQSGGTTLVYNKKGSVEFTIPAEATGILIRIGVESGDTVNAVVRPFISEADAYSLSELKEMIDIRFKQSYGISPDTDFNLITDNGYHFLSANLERTPSASNPLPNTAIGMLFVLPYSNIVTQILFSKISGKNYIRRYSPSISAWTEWTPLVDDTNYMKKLGTGIAIPSNTDFNDLTETGFAFINAGNNGYVNAPPLNGGVLTVYNTGSIVTQYANSHKTIDNYVRRLFNGVWSDWTGIQNRRSIKILSIGNSGHQDMLTYVPFIMQNVAPELDLTLGITYVSGASIDRQIELFDTDEAVVSFDLCRPRASSWTIKANQTIKQCLLAEDWDVIMVGQASTYQMDFANYSGIPELLDKVATYVGTDHDDYKGHHVKFGYLGPQVRLANNNMVVIVTPDSYPDYMDAVQQALDAYPLEFAIMGGTAVENARGTLLAQYGDAVIYTDSTHTEVAITGQMNYDYTHMQEGIGCMVGSYCSVLGILELAGINNRSIFGEGTRPDADWVTARNIPGRNWSDTVVGISDANCLIAQKCAIMAHKKPFEISTIV